MWNLISSTMSSRSVILTTHSSLGIVRLCLIIMIGLAAVSTHFLFCVVLFCLIWFCKVEEAEALCMRIGIMVNGQLQCLGSAQHLRSRFGKGYQIDVNFDIVSNMNQRNNSFDGEYDTQEFIQECSNGFEKWIESRFDNWEKLEEQNSHFKYKVDKSLSIGTIFNEIEMNKKKLNIKEYSVSQTSLEQIFMYFARNQLQNDENNNAPLRSKHKSKYKSKSKANVKGAGSRGGGENDYKPL